MPSGYDLDNAIDQGLRTVRSCPDTYDHVFDTLLEIATTREDPANKTKLYNFARTLADERVVPADRTREQFRRYFDADFVSIPERTPSVAGSCRTLPQLKDDLRMELQQKRLGFEQVMGDEEGFLVVQASHTRFVQAIETVCSTFDESAGGW